MGSSSWILISFLVLAIYSDATFTRRDDVEKSSLLWLDLTALGCRTEMISISSSRALEDIDQEIIKICELDAAQGQLIYHYPDMPQRRRSSSKSTPISILIPSLLGAESSQRSLVIRVSLGYMIVASPLTNNKPTFVTCINQTLGDWVREYGLEIGEKDNIFVGERNVLLSTAFSDAFFDSIDHTRKIISGNISISTMKGAQLEEEALNQDLDFEKTQTALHLEYSSFNQMESSQEPWTDIPISSIHDSKACVNEFEFDSKNSSKCTKIKVFPIEYESFQFFKIERDETADISLMRIAKALKPSDPMKFSMSVLNQEKRVTISFSDIEWLKTIKLAEFNNLEFREIPFEKKCMVEVNPTRQDWIEPFKTSSDCSIKMIELLPQIYVHFASIIPAEFFKDRDMMKYSPGTLELENSPTSLDKSEIFHIKLDQLIELVSSQENRLRWVFTYSVFSRLRQMTIDHNPHFRYNRDESVDQPFSALSFTKPSHSSRFYTPSARYPGLSYLPTSHFERSERSFWELYDQPFIYIDQLPQGHFKAIVWFSGDYVADKVSLFIPLALEILEVELFIKRKLYEIDPVFKDCDIDVKHKGGRRFANNKRKNIWLYERGAYSDFEVEVSLSSKLDKST